MIDVEAKLQAVAEILEGRVIKDDPHLAVFVKGSVTGFPAMMKAISLNWPFGVMYFLETEVVEDPNRPSKDEVLQMTVTPRFGKGFMSFFAHIFLFEARGESVGDRLMESKFIFSHNSMRLAERFVRYPGMAQRLLRLLEYSKFSELQVKTDAGLFLSQPKSFTALDLDV